MALTKATHRMIEGASVNVKDFGAVGDGVTDDTVAIQAAIDYASDNGGKDVFIPAGEYVSTPIIIKAGVNLKGEGSVHKPFYVDPAYDKTGTVLLIEPGVGDDCLSFVVSSRGHQGIYNLSVFATGTAARKSVVAVNGALHIRMEDSEFGGLTTYVGVGLDLARTATTACIYGTYRGIVTTGVHTGLRLTGDANANSFSGCAFGAQVYTLLAEKHVPSGTLPVGNSFAGVSFESNFNTSIQDITYLAVQKDLYGFSTNASVYINEFFKITHCKGMAFTGCYWENGGVVSPYDDGVNGSKNLAPVVSLNAAVATDITNVSINGCRMAAYLYTKGTTVTTDSLPNGKSYSNISPAIFTRRNIVATVVPSYTLTSLTYTYGMPSITNDFSRISYDNATGIATFKEAGTYRVYAQIAHPAITSNYTFLQATFAAHHVKGPLGNVAGQQSSTVDCLVKVAVNDTVVIQLFQASGGNVTMSGAADYSHLSIVKL